jgi:hypothetical protein
MTISSFFKRHLKKTLLTITLAVVGLFLFFTPANKGEGSAKTVFFLVHTEPMGGKGVYEMYTEMKAKGHRVKIVAIPYFYAGKLATDIDPEFMKKFDVADVIYPCGKQGPYTEKCHSIDSYKPDYIFTQNPYNAFKDSVLDPVFVDDSLKKIAKKVMYIPYGPHLFHQGWISDPNLSKQVHTVFVDSKSTQGIYVDAYKFQKDRAVVSGYQTYKTVRDMMGQKQKKEFKETILWLPRWSLSFRGRDMYESGSTFLMYYHFFYNYAVQNPDIRLILRPHVSLFPRAVENQHLSQENANEIVSKFQSLKNVVYSQHVTKSLVEDIMEADVVIADGTSALAEVVVADKPIIYLSNGLNLEFDSVPLSREFKKYIYMAYDPRDIVAYLEQIRANQYGSFQETPHIQGWAYKFEKLKSKLFGTTLSRTEFKKMLDPVENPAKFIADYIWHDSLK